jgi:hypothetical protein
VRRGRIRGGGSELSRKGGEGTQALMRRVSVCRGQGGGKRERRMERGICTHAAAAAGLGLGIVSRLPLPLRRRAADTSTSWVLKASVGQGSEKSFWSLLSLSERLG